MRSRILILLILSSTGLCSAGTGQTKDMDLMYFLILSVLGVIILIWDSIDYISKNQKKIINSLRSAGNAIRRLIQRIQNNGTTRIISTKGALN